MKRFFALGMLLLLLSGSVLALGISPGRTTMDFSPGLERDVSFSLFNEEGEEGEISLFVEGELKDYLSLSESSYFFISGETSAPFHYTVTLPPSLENPGIYTGSIVAIEVPEEKLLGNRVGAQVAVASQLYVYVPYPGKYPELDPKIVTNGEEVLFYLAITNRGKENITLAQATIDIYQGNLSIATLTSNSEEILSTERIELLAQGTEKIVPGSYRAVITLDYDGERLTLEKGFTVGELSLVIESLVVNDFKLGGIAKFNALVENTWSEPLDQSYLQLQVYGPQQSVIADIKSQVYTLPPHSKTIMIAYWDTADVQRGEYPGTLRVFEGNGQYFEQTVTLALGTNSLLVMGLSGEVIMEQFRGPRLYTTLLIALVVLLFLNILWFMSLRKLLLRRKNRK